MTHSLRTTKILTSKQNGNASKCFTVMCTVVKLCVNMMGIEASFMLVLIGLSKWSEGLMEMEQHILDTNEGKQLS